MLRNPMLLINLEHLFYIYDNPAYYLHFRDQAVFQAYETFRYGLQTRVPPSLLGGLSPSYS